MKTTEGFKRADSGNLPKVDLPMLLEYMHTNDVYNAAEIRGAKILMSSRDSYVDTAVGYVEVKREKFICTLKARITPEHRVRTKMYSVTIVVDEGKETIQDVTCDDCAAAAGGCKHGICLVQWLIKRTDEPSVTSVTCYWKKAKLNEIVSERSLPASEIGKKKKFEKVTSSLTLNHVLEECKKRKVTEALLCNYADYEDDSLLDCSVFNMMVECYQKNPDMTYDSFKLFGEQYLTIDLINEVEKSTKSQGNSTLWHSLRQSRVTASNIYDATKCSTANGALVKSIMGGYKVPETKAIQRGKCLEKKVVEQLMKDLNVTIETCGLVLVSPILGASPDGLTEKYVVEIKCPSKQSTIKNYITEDNIIKDKFKSQIMLQMHATKRTKGLFCVADPDFENNKTVTKIWIDYDKVYLNNLIQEAEKFWKLYIFNKVLDCVK